MSTAKTTMDEMIALGDLNGFLNKAKEQCEFRIKNQRFAGMDKEDIVQEVLLKVANTIDQWDSSKAKASTFFSRVIDNQIKDLLKKAGAEKNLMVVNAVQVVVEETFDEDSTFIPLQFGEVDYGFENAEFVMDLMDNMGLNEREKEIFKLRSSGYEFVEIAEIYGVNKSRISQIWKSIKTKYSQM